jgi:hypothetical protein
MGGPPGLELGRNLTTPHRKPTRKIRAWHSEESNLQSSMHYEQTEFRTSLLSFSSQAFICPHSL